MARDQRIEPRAMPTAKPGAQELNAIKVYFSLLLHRIWIP
ncbi:hypothetical protein MTAT_12750 [Moorella thermoacetica]|uniref:Uncharacterized protein n=1 Tax=Neomoorella thermoacetica TaxID=1525 RepID=A0ABY3N804_NEOTH|nr:hypothetical protein MTAT_12750 [Moorella thermoacetica]